MTAKQIKCVVWDLDNTLWKGTLLEGDDVAVPDGVRRTLETLDRRGILHSIASKNDAEAALARLRSFGLEEYFLYPQIGWGAKSKSIQRIAESLNLAMDSFAFVDDQVFEREEVFFSLPQVLCIDAANLDAIPDMPEMNPRFTTEESGQRRQMYQSDQLRRTAEDDFEGPKEDFLASLDMHFSVGLARLDDLRRAEELTVRTHQLNTTGYTYSYDELEALRVSPGHVLLTASLRDAYGSYGTVGLALIEHGEQAWTLMLLLMSCRVMSRGAGTILLHHVMERARRAGVSLRAEFLPNDVNRMMFITFKFAGFKEVTRRGKVQILESDLERIQPCPHYVTLEVRE